MTTYLGKSCSFCLPRVPFVNCRQFMYLVISLLVLRAGYGIWLYQFLIIAYRFTLHCVSNRFGWVGYFSLSRLFLSRLYLSPSIRSGETSNHAKANNHYSLLICSISACSKHQYLLSWLNSSCKYNLTCRNKEQKKRKKKTIKDCSSVIENNFLRENIAQ